MRLLISLFKQITVLFVVFASVRGLSAPYQPFMWQVQHQRATVYLVGSIHALTEDYYPLPAAYYSAFSESDRIAVELDPTSFDPYTSKRLVQQHMWLPEGITLAQYLSDEQLTLLQSIASKEGFDYQQMLRLRPWMLIDTLTQFQLTQSRYKTELGLDLHFIQRAKQQNKPILELESLAEQINAMAGAPFNAQLAMLESSLDQLEDLDYMHQMVEYWRTAQPDKLYHFVYKDVERQPELQPMLELLLDRRNRHMADIINLYLTQAPLKPLTTFVIVGALHLSGPNSILAELKQKGFSPHPMFTPPP